MENEQLKNESIASLYAMMEFAQEQINSKNQAKYYREVRRSCTHQIAVRIKQIFP